MASNNASAGLAHGYIIKLEKDYECAQHRYEEVLAAAQKADSECQMLEAMRAQVAAYLQRAEDTRELMGALKDFLEHFKKDYLEDVFYECVQKAEDAVKLIVKSTKCLSYLVEGNRQDTRALIERIDCLNSPALSHDTAIMKCLLDFLSKTEESMTANLAAIKAVLELLKQLVGLRHQILHKDELNPPDVGKFVAIRIGLIADVERIMKLLSCGACDEDANLYFQEGLCPTEEEGGAPTMPCKMPIVSLPEEQPEPSSLCDSSGGAYVSQLQDWLNRISAHLQYTKCVKSHYTEKKSKIKAARDAIKSALDEAKAVQAKCK
jgi:hypothetical protein